MVGAAAAHFWGSGFASGRVPARSSHLRRNSRVLFRAGAGYRNRTVSVYPILDPRHSRGFVAHARLRIFLAHPPRGAPIPYGLLGTGGEHRAQCAYEGSDRPGVPRRDHWTLSVADGKSATHSAPAPDLFLGNSARDCSTLAHFGCAAES